MRTPRAASQSGTPWSRLSRAGAWALALLAAGCQYPATEVRLEMDTDIAADRVLTLTAEVRTTGSSGGRIERWNRTDGGRDGLRFPASFAVVPRADGPRDEAVTVVLDLVAAATRTQPEIAIRRTTQFNFIPRVPSVVRVFLSTACGAPVSGCRIAGACTVSTLCEERDQTCGDQGTCVLRMVTPMPLGTDAGMDAMVRADVPGTSDRVAIDSPRDVPTADVPGSDVPGGDTCTRACTGRTCGPDGCGGSCGACPTDLTCDASGTCACNRNCSGRNCGADGCGGSCGSCTGSDTCNGSGVCVPPACGPDCSGRNCGPDGCGGSCGSCGGGQTCNGSGVCVCVPTCAGRVCGPDSCGGGSCGSCDAAYQTCNAAGACVCVGIFCGRCCPPSGVFCGGSGGTACCDGVTCGPGCPC